MLVLILMECERTSAWSSGVALVLIALLLVTIAVVLVNVRIVVLVTTGIVRVALERALAIVLLVLYVLDSVGTCFLSILSKIK